MPLTRFEGFDDWMKLPFMTQTPTLRGVNDRDLRVGSQSEILFHEILDVQKILVG